jgi:hypothetical protein
MFSKEKSGAAIPDVPSSLNHDSFEMSSADKQQLAPHFDTAASITPYLGFRARLSQLWFNRWTVLLVLVLVRVLLLLGSLNTQLDNAKEEALASCSKVEDVGSAMASMPHYLSVGVNSLAADGITKAVSGMMEVLMDILEGVEQLIIFVIEMYIGTYACLAAALIHGGLDVATAVVTKATDVINTSIKSITGDITNDISSVQSDINKVFSEIASVASVLGSSFTAPTINITGQLNSLNNIQVNTSSFVQDLSSLNSTIPTFAQVKNLTEMAISTPFDLLKTALNQSYGNYSFDSAVFPVAQKQTLTFCSDNSSLNDFFNSLYALAATAEKVFIVVLVLLALAAIVPMYFLELRRWRRQQRHARVFTKHGYDPMDVVYISSRPMTATLGIKLASRFSGRRQLLVRWAVAYATSLPAIFVLSLALAGLLSCACTAIVLKAVEQQVPALAAEVGDFANQVVTTLENASTEWARDANGVITNLNTEVNNDLFGWVTNATSAVNNTLNTFDDDINKSIQSVFNNTVLLNTVQNLVNCLIGNKITSVEKGLTWVHDNAHVTFPTFPADVFSQGAAESIGNDTSLTSFLASTSSVTSDDITAAVDKVVTTLYNGLIQEALIATALLLLYVIVVLLGIVRTLAAAASPAKTRAEGGQRFMTDADQLAAARADGLTGDRRAPLSPRVAQGAGGGGAGTSGWRDADLVDEDDDDYHHNGLPQEPAPSYPDEKRAMASGGAGPSF